MSNIHLQQYQWYVYFIQSLFFPIGWRLVAPDFCLWAPSTPNKTVGESEGEMVAWCTKPGHGTRLIPDGLLTGLQFLKTPDYIQVVGFMSDQTLINLALGDYGGEMDPHGADLVGLFSYFFIPQTLSNSLSYSVVTPWEVSCILQTSLVLILKSLSGPSSSCPTISPHSYSNNIPITAL